MYFLLKPIQTYAYIIHSIIHIPHTEFFWMNKHLKVGLHHKRKMLKVFKTGVYIFSKLNVRVHLLNLVTNEL